MKTKKKITWLVRYYDVKFGFFGYRVFAGLSVREIDRRVADFIESNKNYFVRITKNYKAF